MTVEHVRTALIRSSLCDLLGADSVKCCIIQSERGGLEPFWGEATSALGDTVVTASSNRLAASKHARPLHSIGSRSHHEDCLYENTCRG